MKTYTNFILALIVFAVAVSGCKYGYQLTGDTKKESSPAARKSNKETTDGKIFEDKRTTDEDSSDEETSRSTVSSDTGSLAGKWVWSRTGSSTVSSSDVYLGGNGSRFTYEFSEEGAVKYTGAMSAMNGGCRMLVTSVSEGQATLDGDNLNIEWEPGSTTREDSCSSSQNYTKETPAETQNIKIRFQEKSSQEQLCLIEKEETCFSRAE